MPQNHSTIQAFLHASRELRGSKFVRETGWLVSAKLVQGLASILATLVIARQLGPELFGQLSLAVAAASLVSSAAALGLEHIASRELAASDTSRHASIALRTIRWMRLFGATVGSGVIVIFAMSSWAYNVGIQALLLVLVLLPLAQIGDVSEWRLIAAGRSRAVATAALVVSPAAAVIRVLLALKGFGVETFAWLLVGEWALRSMILALAGRSKSLGHREDSADLLPKAAALLRESMPLLLSGIAVVIYMRLDQFMIAAMLDPRHVGLYSAVVTISEAPLVLPAILLRASLPLLTRLAATNPTELRIRFEQLLRATFYFHAVAAGLLCIFAQQVLHALYGPTFADSVLTFQIIVLGAPFVAMGVLSSAWLVIHRQTDHALKRTLLGVLTNAVLNLILIPRFGIAGAAIATLVAQIVATYAADACYAKTRDLFLVKSRALMPLRSRTP